ncbi:MAG: polyprenyl synthetase family protein [Oscillospiraceae bacterium]|nr:polyprenyl synthetase family protein [Oscillospiraceae bacterium]
MELQEAIRLSERQVRDALCNTAPGLDKLTGYLSQSMGKGVRTQLLLTAAANPEGEVPEDAAKAAAALELLHMATLVHDDVIDDAATRRGMPSLHQKFGTKSAVICGDYLLSLSLVMLADMDRQKLKELEGYIPLAPRLSRALSAICRGEYTQHINVGNLDLDLPTYLRIISGKTAMLFFIAAYIGGVLGGEPPQAARSLGRFGRCLGMLFQIADDCKDYEWTEALAQKPVANDIKIGVVTLPLILAMAKDPNLRAGAQAVMQTQSELGPFIQAVRDAGGSDAARVVAARYARWGEQALRGVSTEKRKSLLKILHSVNL